ncbi:glycosyltransferase [Wenzhouxiangella limi]|uniref:Glycosyltransferase n=1 Tax=Wenzhouxiangella limi TaxID=2707351 RepID=A0A845V839_9GAMM|nr:glycosyltransferase [Wenzhouxiangella limi]NDY96095.1 glycosyltransferase [Wenzhouxiangella limi]
MHKQSAGESAPIQLIALRGGDGRIDEKWLADLPLRPGDPDVQVSRLTPRAADFARCLDAAREYTRDCAVMFVRSGLRLPQRWRERLTAATAEPTPLPRLPAGNYADPINPLAGFDAFSDADTADRWLWLCAEHQATPVEDFPLDCLYLPHGSAAALDERSPALLIDSLFVFDPARCVNAGDTQPTATAATLGSARLRLQALADEQKLPAPPPRAGLDGRPVTLHISHDWGGGVARWIEDVALHDTEGHHLVLSASGNPAGTTHGQVLRLYAAGPGQALVRELPLTPSIADTVRTDRCYRQLLAEIVRRFAVGRVLVSSLIGHSLDALRTGLPTAQMLHDFYPAWPLLDRDPLDWAQTEGGVDLARALSEHGQHLLFRHPEVEHWQSLAKAWLEAVGNNQVQLLAPTAEVVRRWQALIGSALPEIDIIGHGFSGWDQKPQSVSARPRADGRLNLVVAGRLSPGKGLALLDQSLDALAPLAHITLLGCGRHGMRFFGRPGVDIVLDYQRDQLPALLQRLGPQAGLFLSTVPETWNYTLSELRAVGVPPLATRLGSFIERIAHGRDGWLFEPQPESLIELVSRLHNEPEQLAAAAASQPGDPDMASVLKYYWGRISALNPSAPTLALTDPRQAAIGRLSLQIAAARRDRAELKGRQQELQAALAQRADWARRYERLSEERTRWAQALEREIEAERVQTQARLDALESERQGLERSLIDTRAELHVSQDHLAQTRAHLQSTQQDLHATQHDLQATQQDLHRSDHELERAQEELRLIFASRSWRWTRPLRFGNRVVDHARHRDAWNPLRWPRLARRLVHSLRFHGLRGTLQLAQGTPPAAPVQASVPVVQAPAEHAPAQPVRLPNAPAPRASIVVPVYNKVAYTAACLESLHLEAGDTPFEVIVVDDCSSDETADFLGRCEGVEVVSNAENSGFIASCNAGAERARAPFLVFLNNDATLTPGWLEALLQTFEDFPDAGIVGARLAYPDGRLQEAGGIIFSDASGWNYGRNEDPALPQYNFTSEADYVSGACLAIPRALFEELGGFDSHYAPAYYEDTDLCFRVRRHGRKVYCQPACTIIHHEGVSSGTDETSGTKRYQAVNREKFRQRWRDALTRQPPHRIDSDRPDPVRRARFHHAAGRALVIDATTPMPDHDSGSVRITALMELMVEHNWRVTFCPQNLKWEGRYSSALQRQGIEVLSAPAISALESWLKNYGPDLDLVLVSRHYVLAPILKALRRSCPHARIVFDTVDLHFLREQRQAELSGSDSMQNAADRTRKIELGLMDECDITLVVSTVEQQLLTELLPEADIRVLSNIHSIHGRQQGWAARRDLLFVGGFQHPPNVDAAEWLIDEIFPRVREQLPDVKLHLIGSRMPDALRERARPGIMVHGFVEDLTPYLNGCRLSLAPLRYGAGVKGKVNQAMAWGLPVVATTCAAEGMFLRHGEDVLLAEDGESFAAEVVRAYQNEPLWRTLSDGGLANVERHFSRAAAGRVVAALLTEKTEPGLRRPA